MFDTVSMLAGLFSRIGFFQGPGVSNPQTALAPGYTDARWILDYFINLTVDDDNPNEQGGNLTILGGVLDSTNGTTPSLQVTDVLGVVAFGGTPATIQAGTSGGLPNNAELFGCSHVKGSIRGSARYLQAVVTGGADPAAAFKCGVYLRAV